MSATVLPESQAVKAVHAPPAMPHLPSFISLFEDEDTRWQAVHDRNTNADGFFVYGVRTTRIYCRPICKARLARRANVSFYNTPAEARDAGFRACKRCKPEMEGFMPEEAAVRKIRAFVSSSGGGGGGTAEGEDGLMSLGQMAKKTGLSKWHFHRVFKRCVGVTPVEYVRMRRKNSQSLAATEASTTPAGSESPMTDMDVDWLRQLDMADFDFGSLDPALALDNPNFDAFLDPAMNEDVPWTDLLSWPEGDLVPPP